ncbi:MAG: hypothetical protein KF832_03220 [Caldilineaceae bacterium]|nr:hypothetical protein [Caldilineaceae bacterium]
MEQGQIALQHGENLTAADASAASPKSARQPFVPPKLTFVTPKLTKQGSVTTLTAAGLISTFSP